MNASPKQFLPTLEVSVSVVPGSSRPVFVKRLISRSGSLIVPFCYLATIPLTGSQNDPGLEISNLDYSHFGSLSAVWSPICGRYVMYGYYYVLNKYYVRR